MFINSLNFLDRSGKRIDSGVDIACSEKTSSESGKILSLNPFLLLLKLIIRVEIFLKMLINDIKPVQVVELTRKIWPALRLAGKISPGLGQPGYMHCAIVHFAQFVDYHLNQSLT